MLLCVTSVYAHVWGCTCPVQVTMVVHSRRLEGDTRCPALPLFTLFFWDGVFTHTGVRLMANKPRRSSRFCATPQSWDCRCRGYAWLFLHGCWGPKLMSSCLSDKWFLLLSHCSSPGLLNFTLFYFLISGIREVKTSATDGFDEFPFDSSHLCCGQEQGLMARTFC